MINVSKVTLFPGEIISIGEQDMHSRPNIGNVGEGAIIQ